MPNSTLTMPRKKTNRNDKAVKFDRNLGMKAGFIAEFRGIPIAEYLSEMCRKQIESDWIEVNKAVSPPGKLPKQ